VPDVGLEIRPAEPHDVDEIVAMVHELAAFEKAADECHLTPAQLREALFGERPAVFGHVAVLDGGHVGAALWFLNFSTWTGTHGVYLEDLFVRPAARGTGAGKALVAALAAVCVEQGYERLEWAVLDWNPALGFYKALGAQIKHDWLPHRLAGDALRGLADAALKRS
jgi:GNAT superfamily N-acetyltransferase